MLDLLKQKNPQLELHHVESTAFETYGRVIKSLDTEAILAAAGKIENPLSGSSYVASQPEFETLAMKEAIQNEFFGSLPAQIGYCWGHNNFMNATVWHACSEITIAVTPLVLILGHVWDVKEDKIDSSMFQAFYLPKGTAVEVYATTLHFCPCEVSEEGFGCVVALSQGTNTDLQIQPADKKLFRKNKWIICHEQNEALLARGVVPGITGINYKVAY